MKTHILTEQEIERYIDNAVQKALREQLPEVVKKATQKEWLTREEIKELTGYSDRTLQHLRDTRQIPFSQHGRKILYPRKGIEEYLQENLVTTNRKGGQS